MEFQPVNLVELMGVTLGTLVVLFPVMGLTLRYAVKPVVQALVDAGVLGQRAAEAPTDSELGRLSRRVLELEQELARRKLEPLAPISAPGAVVHTLEPARART